MDYIFIVVLTAGISWVVLHHFVYGPKTQIKRLHREIVLYAIEIGKLNKIGKKLGSETVISEPAINILETKSDRAGAVVDAVFDYYYSHSH